MTVCPALRIGWAVVNFPLLYPDHTLTRHSRSLHKTDGCCIAASSDPVLAGETLERLVVLVRARDKTPAS